MIKIEILDIESLKGNLDTKKGKLCVEGETKLGKVSIFFDEEKKEGTISIAKETFAFTEKSSAVNLAEEVQTLRQANKKLTDANEEFEVQIEELKATIEKKKQKRKSIKKALCVSKLSTPLDAALENHSELTEKMVQASKAIGSEYFQVRKSSIPSANDLKEVKKLTQLNQVQVADVCNGIIEKNKAFESLPLKTRGMLTQFFGDCIKEINSRKKK